MIPKLLFDIARCNNFCSVVAKIQPSHPCNKIVDFQRKLGANHANDFQLREFWSGDIEFA